MQPIDIFSYIQLFFLSLLLLVLLYQVAVHTIVCCVSYNLELLLVWVEGNIHLVLFLDHSHDVYEVIRCECAMLLEDGVQ